jgi:hypothetical protein
MCRRIKRTLRFHQDQILRNCVASLFSSKKKYFVTPDAAVSDCSETLCAFSWTRQRTKIIAGETSSHKADDSHSRAAVVGHCEPLA